LKLINGGTVATNVSREAFIHLKITLTESGVLTIEAGDQSDSKDFGFPKQTSILSTHLQIVDRWSVSAAHTQRQVILDNYSLKINDGVA